MNARMRCLWCLGLATVGLLGCATEPGTARPGTLLLYPTAKSPTLVRTSEEHWRQVAAIPERDNAAIIEDFDLLFLTDRPSRLNKWHSR